MGLGLNSAALVTGGGSGIGRAVSLALAKRGVTVTVVDFSEPYGLETVRLVEAEHAKLSERPSAPSAIFMKCDVSNAEQLFEAFALHERTYGRLDVLLNNAGITDTTHFSKDLSRDGTAEWRKVMDVDVSAVIDGTRLGIQMMRRTKRSGAIVNVASAAGLYPNTISPIYSAAKAGVVMFTRCLRPLIKEGIRVNAFCPEFIETNMALQVPASMIQGIGYISMETALQGIFELIEDEDRAGHCLWVTKRRGSEYWPTPQEKEKYQLVGSRQQSRSRRSYGKPSRAPAIPTDYRKVIVHTLTHDFRAATRIVTVTYQMPVKPGHVLIKYLYAGVNASDVNYSSGRYMAPGEAERMLPLDAGFEAVGLVAGLGEGVEIAGLVLGSPVACLEYGTYGEFGEVIQSRVIQVPVAAPEMLGILTSGLTASIALEQAGKMKSGQTVLVTAAAGGTGQFAVQLAKLAGNKVVATCGGAEKASLLKSLGVDRVIDYRKESVKSVLKEEYPKGIDLIYESVGGEMFTTCLNALATRGCIIVIGMVSSYQGEKGWEMANYPGLCEKILAKSQSVVGFFLMNYAKLFREHTNSLTKLYLEKKLKVAVDPTPFVGLESVADAVEYLHSGRSLGKVVVQIEANSGQQSKL